MSNHDCAKPAPPEPRHLIDLKDRETGIIVSNADRKSTEMGLFPNAKVTMFRNRKSEQSVVIGTDDARFLVSRAIARKIAVTEDTPFISNHP